MILRPATELDVPFMTSSFVQSWVNKAVQSIRRTSPRHYACLFQPMALTRLYHAIFCDLLLKADSTIAEDNGIILGYSVTSPGHVYWVYVKDLYRHQGIGSTLFRKGVEKDSVSVYFLNPDSESFIRGYTRNHFVEIHHCRDLHAAGVLDATRLFS